MEDNPKPHECSTCSKRFAYKNHLKKHEDIHAGIKKFRCESCDKCFSRKEHLHSHTLRIHKEEQIINDEKNKKNVTVLC